MHLESQETEGSLFQKDRHILSVPTPEWDPIRPSTITPEKFVITFSEWFEFPVTPFFLNPEYLQKKYVDENKSADEVASEIRNGYANSPFI